MPVIIILSILGYAPIDGIPRTGIATISVAVTTTIILLHTGGIVFALFCLAFNIINRKKRSVANRVRSRMSDLQVNDTSN